MSKASIYNRLVNAGMTKEGACAMIGNMQAESALKTNNVQDSYNNSLGVSDEQYTREIDNGSRNFIDAAGYGLCQWTYGPRKRNLLNFARSRGTSVADEATQVDFAIKELKTEYSTLWNYLRSTHDLYNATARICREFERPAINNIGPRYANAQAAFSELSNTTPTPEPEPKPVNPGKSVDELAREVLANKWGTGEDRKRRLIAAGYDYWAVQRRVNELVQNRAWPPRQLKPGMEGNDVAVWQALLIAHGYTCNINGSFGPDTARVSKQCMEDYGFSNTGIVTTAVWKKLMEF